MLKDVQVASSNRKCKMDSDDDESGNKLDKKKRRRKTLGVKVKNTGGAANFGKSARLPAFSKLSRSILHNKQKVVSSNSSASSSSSDPYDKDMATEDNNSQSHITISDEHPSNVEGKVKKAANLQPKTEADKDDEDLKSKMQTKQLTRIEYHPLTNKKFQPIENNPFFSG